MNEVIPDLNREIARKDKHYLFNLDDVQIADLNRNYAKIAQQNHSKQGSTPCTA